MGQTLIGRPVSQNQGFPTLGTASSASAPNLAQYLGFLTPPQAPAQQMPGPVQQMGMMPGPAQQMPAPTYAGQPISHMVSAGQFGYNAPVTLGFGGFGGMPRLGGSGGIFPKFQG